MLEALDLPDDIDTLKRLLIESRTRLAERDHEIEHLKLFIAKLRRLQFGRSSEKLDAKIGQLELLVEELEANRAGQAARAAESPIAEPVQQERPARRALPQELPRETIEHLPACTCPDASDCARPGRAGTARAHPVGQVRRSPAAVSAGADLCTRGGLARALDTR